MIIGRSVRQLAAVTLVSTLAGCSSAQKSMAPPDVGVTAGPTRSTASAIAREPSSFGTEQSSHILSRALLAEGAGARTLENEFVDRILRILYRANFYIDRLSEELDTLATQREAGQEVEEPLVASSSYQQVLNLWALYDLYKAEIAAVYRQLIEATNSPLLSEPERQVAISLINQLNRYLLELSVEDRVQLVDVLEALEKNRIEAGSDVAGGSSPGRATASIQSLGKLVIKGNDATTITEAKQAVMREKAQKAAAYNDPMLEPTFITAKKKEPIETPPFKPSTGKDGNVFGMVFPRGTYVLTFDDGPKTSTTSRLLDILSKHRDSVNKNGAGASFFWLASLVGGNPKMIDKAKSLGYPINNHSWDHANLAKQGESGLEKQIVQSTSTIRQATGQSFRFFRCPYGACYAPAVPAARAKIAGQGLIHAYWAIDSADWQNKSNASKTFNFVVKQMSAYPSGIILFHDIHEKSVDAVEMLLAHIKQQNDSGKAQIRLITLEQAVDEINKATAK